jgi:hypothetical protein
MHPATCFSTPPERKPETEGEKIAREYAEAYEKARLSRPAALG